MRIFKIGRQIEVVCQYQKTRNGFRHLATMMVNGTTVAEAKCCYLNRTWEAYEYQSVLQAVIAKAGALTPAQRRRAEKFAVTGYNPKKEKNPATADLRMVAGIARMGELLCPDMKSKNDWQARMLKAGLAGRGLIMPEDWDSLTEEDKERRLNGAIGALAEEDK